MLQFFRKNDPYKIIPIFLILVVIRLIWIVSGVPVSTPELKWLLLGEHLGNGFVMYREAFDYTGPLAALVYKILDMIFGSNRWVYMLFSTLLVILQAGILNNILLKNKAYDENNYLPAFFFVILVSAIPDFLTLSPQLMSLTFVILSLNQIFRRIDNVVTDELFLYGGIYTGLATFFYLPSFIYFLAFLISFVVFSSAIARRLIIFVYGFAVVAMIILAYYFWFESLGDFWTAFVLGSLLKPRTWFVDFGGLLQLSYVLLVVFVIVSFRVATLRTTNFQVKMIRVMMLFVFTGGIILLTSPELGPAELLFFVPPMAFLMTHFFLNLKKRWPKLILPILFLGSLTVYPWLLRNNWPMVVADSSPAEGISNKKVMLLGDDLSMYQNNRIASPFLDPYISQQRLKGLDYFLEAAELHDLIIKSNPDVIIDNWDQMPSITNRFPDIEKAYQKRADGNYWKY